MFSVCLIDKGAEIGAHILSGNVFEPRALDELIPNWREHKDIPIQTKAKDDKFLILSESSSIEVPGIFLPPQLHNDGNILIINYIDFLTHIYLIIIYTGNYIISLSQLARWLGKYAEELGVEIYPGFAADEVLYDKDKNGNDVVIGIATKDVGIGKNGEKKDTYASKWSHF